MLKKPAVALLVVLVCRAQGAAGQAPVYKLLYSPPPSNTNLGSFYELFEGKPGLFYVLSAWTGGTTGASIFTVSSGGVFKPIYSFPPATFVNVLQPTNGELYGSGYTGIPPNSTNFYYSMGASGGNLQEYPMPAPWAPGFETTVAPPNQMYDLVGQITTNHTLWAFARVSESGRLTILHQFTASEGVPAYTAIILGPDGNFYGIGAQSPVGISPTFIYQFTPAGAYSRILTFPQVPSYDALPIVAATDGNIYGTFAKGGVNNTGLIYQATLSGQLHLQASFPASISSPRTLMQAADGDLYGTTVYNQIFRYNLTTHALTLVYQMDVAAAQGECPCALVEGTDGRLYGAASNGGPYPGMGAVFSLDIGLPKPLPAVTGLYPSSGAAGQKVLLWGNYLLGATSVSFDGVPAQYIGVTSIQSVWATVPAGAATGPVTVTTPIGSFTTTTNFTVP